ncbi:alpha-N-acetylgalactosaminidase precursor [Pelomyxa schiedti]|nr:alpha-N-acetylgalactosaminidase precursor [Pelomyxa schiedti]
MKPLVVVVGLFCCLFIVVRGLDNGLALTPPMGWLAWERFRCEIDCTTYPDDCISEKLFTDMADRLVADGYRDLGYKLVNIDDCWTSKERATDGTLVADPDRFPHGIPWLAQYMHDRGLLLGIYGDYGNYTCGGYPGSIDYLELDANTFASWGVDMLKLDGCYADPATMDDGYTEMEHYLNESGRPMIYSCSWPDYQRLAELPINWELIAETCNLWRMYNDIQDSWASVLDIIHWVAQNQESLYPWAKPGAWNDMDMLIIGDFGLSLPEQRTQMALWSIWASPMLMSNDLRDISADSVTILQNSEIIAVSQDALGQQGVCLHCSEEEQVWARQLDVSSTGAKRAAAALFNPGPLLSTKISISFYELGFTTTVLVRDLYSHKDLGVFTGQYTATVGAHDTAMLLLTATS